MARYQLTRPAANASSSYRTAKIGKPHASMNEAIRAAMTLAKPDGAPDVTITDLQTGEWARAGRAHYVNGPHAGTRHVTLSLPQEWAERMPVLAGWAS